MVGAGTGCPTRNAAATLTAMCAAGVAGRCSIAALAGPAGVWSPAAGGRHNPVLKCRCFSVIWIVRVPIEEIG